MLRETGERLLPDEQVGRVLHSEHLARYRLATHLAPGRRVLDAASGEGYGTAMLATAGAASVVGVDFAPEAVEHARSRYGLDFRQGDVAELPFEDDSFDLIVSFETIEHVPDPPGVLAEMRRTLAPDGLLVISTPNAGEYHVDNPFHLREFETGEFAEFLTGEFSDVRLLYQQNWLTSAIFDEEAFAAVDVGEPLALDLAKTAARRPGEEVYTVALCGSVPHGAPSRVAVMGDVFELHALLEAAQLDGAAERTRQRRDAERWRERARAAERLVATMRESAAEPDGGGEDHERLALESAALRGHLEVLERRLADAEAQLVRAEQRAAAARARALSAEARLSSETESVRNELEQFKQTRRYRTAKALASPLDAARRLRGG